MDGAEKMAQQTTSLAVSKHDSASCLWRKVTKTFGICFPLVLHGFLEFYRIWSLQSAVLDRFQTQSSIKITANVSEKQAPPIGAS